MYIDLLSFEMEIMNMPLTKTYQVTEEEKVPIFKSWLGREGLQLIQAFKTTKKEAGQNSGGNVFHVKPYHNETILSLKYCKYHKSAKEWMGRLHIKATDCKNKEYDKAKAAIYKWP